MAVRRGQVGGFGGTMIAIFVALMILVIFAIILGYLKEKVAPDLGLNETLPKVTGIVDKGFTITNTASSLLLLIVVFTLLMFVIGALARRVSE